MSKHRSFLILISLLLLASESIAGVADIAITLDHQPLNDVKLGQIIPFSITITNNGPDTVGADSTRLKPVVANLFFEQNTPLLIAQDPNNVQTCDFLQSFGEPMPGNPLIFIYSFYYPPIPAGESTTCYGLTQVFLESGSLSVEWFISSPSDTDPDTSNNRAALNFGVRPPMVPTLSFMGLVLFSMLILVLTNKYLPRLQSIE